MTDALISRILRVCAVAALVALFVFLIAETFWPTRRYEYNLSSSGVTQFDTRTGRLYVFIDGKSSIVDLRAKAEADSKLGQQNEQKSPAPSQYKGDWMDSQWAFYAVLVLCFLLGVCVRFLYVGARWAFVRAFASIKAR